MNGFIKYIQTNNGGRIYDLIYSNKVLEGKYSGCNTTCAWYNNELVINTRLVDYAKIFQSDRFRILPTINHGQTYIFKNDDITSRNITSVFKNNRLNSINEVNYNFGNVINTFYKGFEDCRLVVWDGALYSYGTRWDKIQGEGCICIYELGDDMQPVNEIVVPPLYGKQCEKNWGAIEDKPFTFVYYNNPMTVLRIDDKGSYEIIRQDPQNTEFSYDIKGSTPVVRYDENTYMSLVHSNKRYVENDIKYTDYVTAFVFYDNDLNIVRMSDWFVFNSPMCEFTCGLAIHDGNVYITYSQLDCTSHLIVTNKECIENFVEYNKVDYNSTFSPDEYYVMAKIYENDRQFNTSSVLYNYAGVLLLQNGIYSEKVLECFIKSYSNITYNARDFCDKRVYDELLNSIHQQIEHYPDCYELYYFAACYYKLKHDFDNYSRYKALAEERKLNVHKYFFKYFNPDYL